MLRSILTLSLLFCGFVSAKMPNIVVILADDMGIGDVSHNGGKAPTPHLDRLAKEGLRFTDGHSASSVCTPTRYALLTGRYNWRSPLKKSVLWGPSDSLIRNGETILPRFLGEAGYHSLVIGKWHLGLDWAKLDKKAEAEEGPTQGVGWDIDFTKRVKNGPCDLGFTEDFLFPASLDMAPYVYLRNDKVIDLPTVTKELHPGRKGPGVKDMTADQCLIDFAREARAFIGRQGPAYKEKGNPFFLYLPLTSPHTPIAPSKEWLGKSDIGKYGDFVMETDWVVGEVVAELEKQGVLDDTMIFFTTDNGCSPAAKIPDLVKQGHLPNGKLRGHKADIYEGGHRVPFIVRMPARMNAGKVVDRTVCQTDIYATCAEAIGKPLGDSVAPDSVSFMPTLVGKEQEPRIATVHHSITGDFAIRKGPWKLCLCPGSGGWSNPKPREAWKDESLPKIQLFNLDDDPAEQKNLQAEHPEKVKELADELIQIINNGRSTPGPKQENNGKIPFKKEIIEMFPGLAAGGV